MRYKTHFLRIRRDPNRDALLIAAPSAISLDDFLVKEGGRVVSVQLVGDMTPNAQPGFAEAELHLVLEYADV